MYICNGLNLNPKNKGNNNFQRVVVTNIYMNYLMMKIH